MQSLTSVLDTFLFDAKSRRLSSTTQKSYRTTLHWFLTFLQEIGVSNLEELNHIHIRQYLAHLQEKGNKSATQHDHAKIVRVFCNFCVREELLKESPFLKVKMPQLDKLLPVIFTDEEISRVLDACESKRDKALCYLLLDSGMRQSEAIALNIEDIDMKTGAVTVLKGKGSKQRIVYIGTKTKRYLTLYFVERGVTDATKPVFVSENNGERIKKHGVSQLMIRLRDRSKVKKCSTHTFRRTFATKALKNGMPMMMLQRLMGHENLEMLKRYVALVQDDLKDASGKYGVVDNL